LKSDRLYLQHILDCISRVRTYTSAGREAFLGDAMQQDAVLRNLQILSESTQRISDETKRLTESVEWRTISGFRNVLVHDYLGIDIEEVWRIIEMDLPDRESKMLALQRRLDHES
jgi:uncharacterized protein with HEPN domain